MRVFLSKRSKPLRLSKSRRTAALCQEGYISDMATNLAFAALREIGKMGSTVTRRRRVKISFKGRLNVGSG